MQKKLLTGFISVTMITLIAGWIINQQRSQGASFPVVVTATKESHNNHPARSEIPLSLGGNHDNLATTAAGHKAEITQGLSAKTIDRRIKELLSSVSVFDENAPTEPILALQKEIIENDDAAQLLMQMMRSLQYTQEDKFMMVELLSARTDEKTVNFTAELISDLSPTNQALGALLANRVMINGNVTGMLSAIVSSNYYEENNKDTVRSVLYGVGNLSMSGEEQSNVSDMLERYMRYGDADIKPVALQSLASLAASLGDDERVKVIFDQYRSKHYSDGVRYSAVESLYNVDLSNNPDLIVKNQLEEIANDRSENYRLRGLAMQLLAGFNNP